MVGVSVFLVVSVAAGARLRAPKPALTLRKGRGVAAIAVISLTKDPWFDDPISGVHYNDDL